MESKKVGQFIQDLRKSKRLTQNELAELIGVTDKAISRWETGDGFPEITIIPKLAKILNVTTDELLNGERLSSDISINNKVKLKFNFDSLVAIVINISGYLIGIFLSYTFYQPYIGFLPIILTSVGSLIYYLFSRFKYLSEVQYDINDKKAIFINTKRFYIVQIFTILMYLPIPISHSIILNANGVSSGIISLESYLSVLPIYLLVGLIVSLISSIIHSNKVIKNGSIKDFFIIQKRLTISSIKIIVYLVLLILSLLFDISEFYVYIGIPIVLLIIQVILLIKKRIPKISFILSSLNWIMLFMTIQIINIGFSGIIIFLTLILNIVYLIIEKRYNVFDLFKYWIFILIVGAFIPKYIYFNIDSYETFIQSLKLFFNFIIPFIGVLDLTIDIIKFIKKNKTQSSD